MGSGEAAGTPTKAPKTSSAQEQPAAGAAATGAAAPFPPGPEWAAAFQAYCPTPPPGYQPHPYMWGTQPMMPYGTGPYYPYMPPGPHAAYGQYAGMAPPGSANDASAGGATDTDGKSSDGKERSPMKKSKNSLGSLGMLSKGSGEAAKSGSANGVVSQSGESNSEGSSDGSDEDGDKRNVDQMNTEGNAGQPGYGAQGGSAFVSPGGSQAGGKGVGTNLNMGMDYWTAPPGNQSSGKGKRGAQPMVPPMPGGQMHSREGVPPELWLQDERELKRQRRKQSNRESARRSRLRKQAECEELAQRVETLTMENMSLRQELEQALEERNKLAADNAALLEQLQKGGTRGSESTTTNINTNNNSSNNNGNEVDAQHQNSAAAAATTTTSTDVNMVERNGRVEGENCETVGKAAIEAASRGEAVAAAG